MEGGIPKAKNRSPRKSLILPAPGAGVSSFNPDLLLSASPRKRPRHLMYEVISPLGAHNCCSV